MFRYLVVLAIPFFVGCGSSSSGSGDGGVVPEKSSSVGPFSISFDPNGNYAHSFDVPIAQSAGKVEYLMTAATWTQFQIASTTATVVGCDASATNVSLLWRPDVNQDGVEIATRGSIHELERGRTGALLVVFGNLNGCQRLRFAVGLKKFL